MKNLLFSGLLVISVLSLTGCYESTSSADATVKTTKKCGASKCGDAKKEPAMKCGAGKCGSAK